MVVYWIDCIVFCMCPAPRPPTMEAPHVAQERRSQLVAAFRVKKRVTIGDVYRDETAQLQSQFAAIVAQRPITVWLHALAEIHGLKKMKSKLTKEQLKKEVDNIRRIAYDTQL